jgi:hypothetical protein
MEINSFKREPSNYQTDFHQLSIVCIKNFNEEILWYNDSTEGSEPFDSNLNSDVINDF